MKEMARKSIANDVTVKISEEDGTSVLSMLVMNDVRTAHSLNFVDDEIEELYEYLKEYFEELNK